MRSITELLDLSGRLAIVTGAAGHLGRAICDTYLEVGARLIAVDADERGLSAYGETVVPEARSRLETARLDIADEAGTRAFCADVAARFGTVDILVHNAAFVGTAAGAGWSDAWETQSAELWRRALEINLTAPFVMTQALTPALSATGCAAVIMVGSIYGLVGPDWRLYSDTPLGNPAAYAASKGGLLQLTRWLATTLAPAVRVNAICPGGLERGQPDPFRRAYCSRTPLGRMATPEDIKGAALYLGSDLSRYVTGQVVAVDGGWTAW